jgi:hypothetical protein
MQALGAIAPVIGAFILIVVGLCIRPPLIFAAFLAAVISAIYFMTRCSLTSRLREIITENTRAYHLALIACCIVYPVIFTRLGTMEWIHVAVLSASLPRARIEHPVGSSAS